MKRSISLPIRILHKQPVILMNMKTVKILAFSVAFAALAGCDSTEMVTYEARSGEAFFETDSYSEFLETGGEHTCTVSVARGNAGGQVSVPVNFSVDNESLASAFDAPSTVEFADGELYADYTFSYDATGLAPGESVVATVSLADTDLPYSTTCSVSIMMDYTWSAYATGTYTSASMEAYWTLTLYRAEEDPTQFRFENWYMDADPSVEEGYDLKFSWDGSSEYIAFSEPADIYGCVSIPTGYLYGSYGMTYLYIDPNYTYYDTGESTFCFNYQFIVSAGYLADWADDTFVIENML